MIPIFIELSKEAGNDKENRNYKKQKNEKDPYLQDVFRKFMPIH
tara:strand:+ start:131 stop:262 length:132 start_codon:yes stop_codon:yes gene_type:complete